LDVETLGGRESERAHPRGISVVVAVTERPSPLDWIYREYSPAIRALGGPFEFVFVIDRWGSNLAGPLQELREAGEPIRVFEAGQGVGESGMIEAVRVHLRGDIVVTIPAYPRVRPEGLAVLVRRIQEGVDVATARRTAPTASRLGRMQRAVFHAILRWGIGGSFEDVASGVRAIRRPVLDEIPIYGDLVRFFPVLAQREGFRVEEVPVPQHPEDFRPRVYSPGIYIRRMIDLFGLFFMVRFTRKPLRFFGLIGAFLSGIGSLILVVLFAERIGGEAIADRPLLLLGILLFVTGVQAIAMGLIGEIIVHLSAGKGRREYRVAESASERL
jgi:hypothetical protein